jgi:hypothetical protein
MQRMEGYCILYVDDPLQGEVVFRGHFRMSQKFFLDIFYDVRRFNPYFICKKDCTGMVGFSTLQKCIAALRMLCIWSSSLHVMYRMIAYTWPSLRPWSACIGSTG